MRPRKAIGGAVYMYSCVQLASREQKAKVPKAEKSRDVRRMPRFACNGWLHITVVPGSRVLRVSLRHVLKHLPYKDIDLPEKWKKHIEMHARTQTPGQASHGCHKGHGSSRY